MLEGVAVVLRVVIELIRVCKEIATGTERIRAANIRTRQTYFLRLFNSKNVFGTAVQRLTHFIADIRIGILVRDDLHSILHTRCTMIGGEY